MCRDRGRLFVMLVSAERIAHYVQGIDSPTLQADPMRLNAVMQRVAMLSHAASRVSAEFRAHHPDIPWHDLAGLHSRLSSQRVDALWQVTQRDLPALIAQIAPYIPAGEDRPDDPA